MKKAEAQSPVAPPSSGVGPKIRGRLEGGMLILTLPWNAAGDPSKSGKSRVHASTHGGVPVFLDDNNVVVVNVNAYS